MWPASPKALSPSWTIGAVVLKATVTVVEEFSATVQVVAAALRTPAARAARAFAQGHVHVRGRVRSRGTGLHGQRETHRLREAVGYAIALAHLRDLAEGKEIEIGGVEPDARPGEPTS